MWRVSSKVCGPQLFGVYWSYLAISAHSAWALTVQWDFHAQWLHWEMKTTVFVLALHQKQCKNVHKMQRSGGGHGGCDWIWVDVQQKFDDVWWKLHFYFLIILVRIAVLAIKYTSDTAVVFIHPVKSPFPGFEPVTQDDFISPSHSELPWVFTTAFTFWEENLCVKHTNGAALIFLE